MANSNPYSPPQVERTSDEPLFQYRFSSRNIASFLASLPIALVTVMSVRLIVAAIYTGNANFNELLLSMLVTVGVLALSTFVFAGFIFPRVWEFRVDREFVSWRMPWPRADKQRIPVESIERVEYHGKDLTILTTTGDRYRPNSLSYGASTEEVLEAIKAAVTEKEPQSVVRENHKVVSQSLMRRLGRAVGRCLRMLRLN